MALKLNYELESGIVLPDAYAHIASFQGNKFHLEAQVTIYKDQAARDAGKQPVFMINLRLPIPNSATFEEMYTEIKKQDPFKTAIDI